MQNPSAEAGKSANKMRFQRRGGSLVSRESSNKAPKNNRSSGLLTR
jgi:hypothetical protein